METNNNPAITVTPDGNVGIGITIPNVKLSVAGTAHFGNDVNAGDSTDWTTIKVGASGAGQGTIKVQYKNAAASAAPRANLSFQPRNNEDTGPFQGAGIEFEKTSGEDSSFLSMTTSKNGTAGERLRIDEIGNVGVGTSNPTDQLSINPSGTNKGLHVQRKGAGTGSAEFWGTRVQNVTASDSLILGYSSTNYSNGGSVLWIGNSHPFIYFPIAGDLRIGAGTGSTAAMTIQGDGNVGIGTTNPETKVEVSGGIYATRESATNTSTAFHFRKRGAVGDATAAVTAGAELGYVGHLGWDGSGYGRGAFAISKATENFAPSSHGANYAIFTTANGDNDATSRVLVDQNENVGIGTTSPSYNLDIQGGNPDVRLNFDAAPTANWAHIYFGDQGTDKAFLGFNRVSEDVVLTTDLDTNGTGSIDLRVGATTHLKVLNSANVGIGTPDPKSSLQVSGYVQLDLTTGAPPAEHCDHDDERGRMVVDEGAGDLYVCMGTGWVAK